MEKKIIITYRWWNETKTSIKESHQAALEESAFERINKMMSQGFTSGELLDNIHIDETDGEDGVNYSGWFEITTESL